MPLWVAWREHAWARLPWIGAGLVPPLLLAGGFTWLMRRAAASDLRKTGLFAMVFVLRLQPDGLWSREAAGETLSFWSSVRDVVAYQGRLLVVLADKVGAGVIIIPPAAFASPAQSAEFQAQLRALWQASRAPEAGRQQGAPCR